ncbi:MAG: toll/interleukin-1 receptor domain-containing protein [Solobacterium sp.]|nr:toll/interleukin-1 receptor domain-containing protein [Solobacterium sp.]
MKQKKVLISYCSADKKYAAALQNFLHENGFQNWLDPYDIPREGKYGESINQSIAECTCCILLFTDEPGQSLWLAKVIERIQICQKPMIPLSIEEIRLEDGIDEESEVLSKTVSALRTIFRMEDEAGKRNKGGSGKKTVIMGEYYYGVDKSTRPLEWIVLENRKNRQLLLSKYVIDNTSYHLNGEVLSWRHCTLRTWLNTTFIDQAFTESEKALFLETERTKTKNIFYDTEDDPKCSDKVFLLSVEEVKKYFSTSEESGCHPTPYAEEKGVFTSGYCLWWLRTPGDAVGMQTYVNAGAKISYEGCYQQRPAVGLRPAVWVRKTR